MAIKNKTFPSRSALRAGGLSYLITGISPRKLFTFIFLLAIVTAVAFTFLSPKDTSSGERTDLKTSRLIINTDKSVYSPNETVYIQIASQDENGKAICNTNLDLSINHQLLTINYSPACGEKGSINPDYYAYFKPDQEGVYKIILRNRDNGDSTEAEIEVNSAPEFSVARWGPTKIGLNPSNRYPMVLTITANRDFRGKISDSLPANFSFAWIGNAEIAPNTDRKTITWDVDLKAGEATELKYEFIVDNAGSKPTYSLGPIFLTEGNEVNQSKNIWNLRQYEI